MSQDSTPSSCSPCQRTLPHWLFVIAVFFFPLKLSLTYIFLIPALLLTLGETFLWKRHHRNCNYASAFLVATRAPEWKLLALFFAVTAISGLTGINPAKSLEHSTRQFLLCLLIPIGTILVPGLSIATVLFTLLSGQSLASLYSVIESIDSLNAPRLFPGAVTESGQLALTVPLAVAIVLRLLSNSDTYQSISLKQALPLLTAPLVIFLLLVATGVGDRLDLPFLLVLAIGAALCIAIAATMRRSLRDIRTKGLAESFPLLVLNLLLPLQAAALLLNLKRGPWVGAFAAVLLLLARYRRSLVLPFLVVALISTLSIPGVRERLDQSRRHFFISGGRATIWKIGADLSSQYPLGIGMGNSPVLRNFAPEIPPELKHFHSNPLNLVVENGWIATSVIVLWLIVIIGPLVTTKSTEPFLVSGIRASILSWQIAGLVEFNMGDTEVLLIALLLVSLLVHLRKQELWGEKKYPSVPSLT